MKSVMKKKLCIVILVYNEGENIRHFVSELNKQLSVNLYDIEYIVVNNGSTDNTLSEINAQAKVFPNLFYIELSKKIEKDYALKAGIDAATGDAVITIDAGLLQLVYLLPQMLKHWVDGYDIVYIYKEDITDRKGFLQLFAPQKPYNTIESSSETKNKLYRADFKLMDGSVVKALRRINEHEMLLWEVIDWIGFLQIGISYSSTKSHLNKPGYSFPKNIAFGIKNKTLSIRPLKIAIGLGLFFSISALLYIPYIFISYFCGFTSLFSGWASLIFTVAFFGGLQLLVLGIIGSYLGKIFLQTKKRPNYIIRSTNLLQTADSFL